MRMITILLLFVAVIAYGNSADSARYDEPTGGFSYVPPAKWRLNKFPDELYLLALDKPAQGFTASISVMQRDYPKSFERMIRETLAGLGRFYEDVQIISQQPFKTDSGIAAHRIVVSGTTHKQGLRQVMFLFDTDGSIKFVMTCTSLLSDGERRDPLFDAAAKSFIRTAPAAATTTTTP